MALVLLLWQLSMVLILELRQQKTRMALILIIVMITMTMLGMIDIVTNELMPGKSPKSPIMIKILSPTN